MKQYLKVFFVVSLLSPISYAFTCDSEVSPEKFGSIGSATSVGDSQAYRCTMRAVWDYINKSQGENPNFQIKSLSVNLSHKWNQWYNQSVVSNSADLAKQTDITDVRFSVTGTAIENGIEIPFSGSAYMNFNRVSANRKGDYAYTTCYIVDKPVCSSHKRHINITDTSTDNYIIEDGYFKDINE